MYLVKKKNKDLYTRFDRALHAKFTKVERPDHTTSSATVEDQASSVICLNLVPGSDVSVVTL